jgi:hypothetical protein
MNRFPYFAGMIFLLLLVLAGVSSAANTTPATTTPILTVTTTPVSTGGNIYFETSPPGATIWLDNVEIGTSPFTYSTDKKGTLDVRARKKGYADATGSVTVSDSFRVDFYTMLTPVTYDISGGYTPPEPVATATTIRQSTITIPTPWQSPTPSPGDPALVIGAAAIGTGLFAIRRR